MASDEIIPDVTSDAAGAPSAEPVTRDRDELHERLLNAAAEAFAEHGYAGARVQQIAGRAGLTTGAMYNRFSGKSALLNEALDQYTDDLLIDLAAANLSATDVLAALGSNLLEQDDDRKTMLLLEAFVAARREPEIAERLRPRMADDRARMAKLVDEEKGDGTFDPALDTQAIVTFCQAVGLGMQLLQSIDADLPRRTHWEQLLARLIGALEPPTQSREAAVATTDESTEDQQPQD